jgi:hypothetical protein
MGENLLLDHFYDYKSGNTRVIVPVWHQIKGATKFYSLFDGSGCLTKGDFESAGLMGCKRGLDTYKPEGGSKITSWLIQLSNQSMIRELKHVPMFKNEEGERTILTIPLSRFDLHDSDNLKNAHFIDLLFSKISASFEPTFILDEFQKVVIEKLLGRLYNMNRRIHMFLQFKLAHPDVDGPTCARRLSINQTSYNKYIKIIRENLEGIINGFDSD